MRGETWVERLRKTVVVGSRGQIVIPVEIRRELNLRPGDRLAVELRGGVVVLRPAQEDLIAKLSGCLADGPSLTEVLIREHAEELERDAKRCL